MLSCGSQEWKVYVHGVLEMLELISGVMLCFASHERGKEVNDMCIL